MIIIADKALRGWKNWRNVIESRSEMGPETAFALRRAKNLLQSKYLRSSRSILTAQIAGLDVLIGCCDLAQPNALADHYSNFYYCTVNKTLCRSLFWLSASIWGSPSFMPYIGMTKGLKADYCATAIPPGLELVWWTSHLKAFARAPEIEPKWLNKVLQSLCGIRKKFLLETFSAAVDYVWLHEAGHVACGHLDIITDKVFDHGESSGQQGIFPKHRAVEIEADRWAMTRLFLDRHKAKLTSTSDQMGINSIVLGISLAHILFYAKRLLARSHENEQNSTHPPLWFRTDDILRTEDLCAVRAFESYRTEPNQYLSEKEWERYRIREHVRRIRCLLALANVHPLFGIWMGPVIDESRRIAGERLIAQANAELEALRSSQSS